MNSGDWRDYATALDDAARGLEVFTGRLADAGRSFEPFAPPDDEPGLRSLYDAHRKLVGDMRGQAHHARERGEA